LNFLAADTPLTQSAFAGFCPTASILKQLGKQPGAGF